MYVISVLVINFVTIHLCWKLLSEPENSHICRTAEYIFEKACAPRFGSVYMYSHCTLKHFKAAEYCKCEEYDACSASHLYHCHGLENEECQSKSKSTFLEWAEGQFDSYLQAGILCDLTNRWQENVYCINSVIVISHAVLLL